jgi:hypothetical protein
MKWSKFGPESFDADQPLFGEPGVRQPDSTGNGLRHMPVALAIASVTDRLTTRHAEPNEFSPSFPRTTPLFSTAHSDPTTYPLVETIEQRSTVPPSRSSPSNREDNFGIPHERQTATLQLLVQIIEKLLSNIGPTRSKPLRRFRDRASQGDTIESARENLREALELFFECASAEEIQQRTGEEVFVTQLEVSVG